MKNAVEIVKVDKNSGCVFNGRMATVAFGRKVGTDVGVSIIGTGLVTYAEYYPEGEETIRQLIFHDGLGGKPKDVWCKQGDGKWVDERGKKVSKTKNSELDAKALPYDMAFTKYCEDFAKANMA